jgi:hypothetical protein
VRRYKQTEMECSTWSIRKIQESEASNNMLQTARNQWLRKESTTNVKSDRVLPPA